MITSTNILGVMNDCSVPLPHALSRILDGKNEDCHFRCRSDVISTHLVGGSSYIELNKSKVIAKVLQPRAQAKWSNNTPLERGILECDVVYANYMADETDTKLQYFSQTVKDSITSALHLHLYPKQSISLSIVVLESSEFDLCAMINAGSLALASAGIEMMDLCTSFGAVRSSSVTSMEETATITVTAMSNLNVITNISVEGRMTPVDVATMSAQAASQCAHIRTAMLNVLADQVTIVT